MSTKTYEKFDPGRLKPNPNAKLSKPFLDNLERLLADNIRRAYGRDGRERRDKPASKQTMADRKAILRMMFLELKRMGYKLEHPASLKEKHVYALAHSWSQRELSESTLRTRISLLRVLSVWIGKPGVVKDIEHYFTPEQIARASSAKDNKAWTARGVDVERLMQEATELDERFGCMLRLQHVFGLRVRESLELCPLRDASHDGRSLDIVNGTKGGRFRRVPILTEEQRAVLAWAKDLVMKGRGKRMRWDGLTYKQANDRFYHLAEKLGITKERLGITPHGLRHGYAQRRVKSLTGGHLTPIEIKELQKQEQQRQQAQPGGQPPKPALTKAESDAANLVVSLELGHGRKEVGGFYYGSYGHQLREPRDTNWYLNRWALPLPDGQAAASSTHQPAVTTTEENAL